MAGFAITLVAFYPGSMSSDSVAQYQQALSGVFHDHHPPLMAWLWSKLNLVEQGPACMLLLHAGLIWSGLWFFGEGAAMRGMRVAWLVLVAGLFPPILGIEGMIWKDVGMAGALLLAAGIIYRSSAGGQRVGVLAASLSLLLIFYAMAIRSNAPAAVGPVAIYWACCVFPRANARNALRAGIGVFVLLLAAQWGMEARLLHVHREHISQMLETFDVAAIHCAGGDATMPAAFIRDGPRGKALCDAFDPSTVDPLYYAEGSPLVLTTDRSALRALGRAWRHAVIASPGTYLAHRFHVFTGLLGFAMPDAPRVIWQPLGVANRFGFSLTPNAITGVVGASVAWALAMGLYNGLLWLVLAAVVIAVAWHNRRRDTLAETVLAVSALCYTLPYFLVALAPDYRYLYWTVMATFIAALLALLGCLPRMRAVNR